MENKDVNITFKLNMNVIIGTIVIFILLSMILFCACYNLPIFKRVREILKNELRRSNVEPFISAPSLSEMKNVPSQVLNDLNDILQKGGDKKKEKDETKKPIELKKPVVEGFFTNIRPN